MLVSRRRFALAAATTLGGMATAAFAARTRPKLLVLLIAEQFRSDYLDLLGNFLGSGGFRRLTDDGAYFPDCRMAAASFTSGGLATLATGAYPQLHGIVADSWYDRPAKRPVQASVDALEATTLAAQLADDPVNRIYSVSLDLREAALVAGAQAELFSMDSLGRFTATGRLADSAWLAALNQSNSAEKQRNAGWYALGARKGAPPLRKLTYDPLQPQDFLALYRSSPFAQGAQMALARELIVQERLGQGSGTDLLVVALGPMALLGYEVGGESPLMNEMVLHLDRQVEALVTLLEKNLAQRNFAVIFTSAHGAAPDPDGRRVKLAIPGETVARTINAALSVHYDVTARKNVYVERYLYPFLYLRLDVLRKSYINLREARALAGRAALTIPGVVGYYTADGDSSHSGDWLRRFRNSFHAVRSGDVMLAYGPDYVEDYGVARGISYGSFYNYDTRVPLILYGAPFEAQTFETTVESVDVAPTLARVAGTAWPSSATGRVLGEALAAEG